MKKMIAVLLSILLITGIGVTISAEDKKMPYTISTVLPDNQIDKKKSYFDLLIESGKEQKLILNLQNNTDHEINIRIIPQNGTTTSTGNINYTGVGQLLENELPYTFTDICSPAQDIRLIANESKDVRFFLTIPEQGFQGVLLGGFQIYELTADENEDTGTKNGSINIKNRFEYIIGVMLRETMAAVSPDFRLEKIEPAVWNSRFALAAELELPASVIVQNFYMDGEVISKKTGDIVYGFEKKSFSMAPNSIYRFLENISPDKLPVGDYTMKLVIQGDENKWQLEKDFEVSSEQKKQAIEKTIEGSNDQHEFVLYMIIGFLLTLIATYSIYRIVKKRRLRDEEN